MNSCSYVERDVSSGECARPARPTGACERRRSRARGRAGWVVTETSVTQVHGSGPVKTGGLDQRTVEGLTEIFRVLGDPTRVRILDALSRGELCVGDLATRLRVTE